MSYEYYEWSHKYKEWTNSFYKWSDEYSKLPDEFPKYYGWHDEFYNNNYLVTISSLMEKNGNNYFFLENVFQKVAIRDAYIYLHC